MPQALAAVNDFVVKFANVNGSGSASANELFARAILRMGVPVSPRNIFPSNIQGLPTWYEVRVTEKGYLGRRGGVDMMVAMNPQTWAEDVKEIEPGGYLFYDSTKPMPSSMFREDINIVGVPLTAITNATYTDARQRQLFKNIIYVGALSVLLDIDDEGDQEAVRRAVQGQGEAARFQRQGAAISAATGSSSISMPDTVKLKVRRADNVGNRIFVEGNNAAALGAVYGGATVCAWYPITPSSSLAEAFQAHCKRLRHDKETGKAKYAIVQAEDELASIGIVIGAGWNGSRAFTSTSGPGISLMTEFIGLASFAEVPAVIVERAARRAVDRHADAHAAVRPAVLRLRLQRRHQARAAVPRGSQGVLRLHRRRARPRRPAADAGVRHDRPRHRHEPPPVRAVRVGRQARPTTAAR